jgi:hypothetical protein
VIRRHGKAFAEAKSVAEYDRICASLRAGLFAAVDGNWDALLANSAERPEAERLARALRAIVVPLLLVGAAIVVPWLPGVDAKPATSARVLLIITAIITAVPGGHAASGLISSSVEKALPWQKHDGPVG